MLPDDQANRLAGIFRTQHGRVNACARSHASGYGGISRPFPEEYGPVIQGLLDQGLIKLDTVSVEENYKLRQQWVWQITDKGRVLAKMMGL